MNTFTTTLNNEDITILKSLDTAILDLINGNTDEDVIFKIEDAWSWLSDIFKDLDKGGVTV